MGHDLEPGGGRQGGDVAQQPAPDHAQRDPARRAPDDDLGLGAQGHLGPVVAEPQEPAAPAPQPVAGLERPRDSSAHRSPRASGPRDRHASGQVVHDQGQLALVVDHPLGSPAPAGERRPRLGGAGLRARRRAVELARARRSHRRCARGLRFGEQRTTVGFVGRRARRSPPRGLTAAHHVRDSWLLAGGRALPVGHGGLAPAGRGGQRHRDQQHRRRRERAPGPARLWGLLRDALAASPRAPGAELRGRGGAPATPGADPQPSTGAATPPFAPSPGARAQVRRQLGGGARAAGQAAQPRAEAGGGEPVGLGQRLAQREEIGPAGGAGEDVARLDPARQRVEELGLAQTPAGLPGRGRSQRPAHLLEGAQAHLAGAARPGVLEDAPVGVAGRCVEDAAQGFEVRTAHVLGPCIVTSRLGGTLVQPNRRASWAA